MSWMLSAKRNYWSMQQSLKKKKFKYYTKVRFYV